MGEVALTYHQRVAGEKRSAIVTAATDLFAADGYDGTSLARIADRAGVSTATLFKQFPTKADLFTAIVAEFWGAPAASPAPLDPREPGTGLVRLGRQYADLLNRPGMAGLHRMVIAEAPRFPELARIQFDLGKEPFFEPVRAYVAADADAGALRPLVATSATTQLLGMISNVVFWPRLLLVEWDVDDAQTDAAVRGAVDVLLAAYAATPGDR